MKDWVKKPTTQAAGLVALGLTLTAAIALLGDKASTTVLLLLTVLAGVFQFLGASKFHSAGKADPMMARASVRRLIQLGVRSREATKLAESAYEQGSAADAKKLMGRLSAELSFIEEQAVQAVLDWREFHQDALANLQEEDSK